jgi:hypothetical protein
MPAHRSGFAVTVGVLLGCGALASSAMAQATCETYGKLALQQQKDNEAAKCGLSGQEWSTDLKGHIDWCTKVGPDKWKVQLQQRTAALEACKAKK